MININAEKIANKMADLFLIMNSNDVLLCEDNYF